MDDGGSERHDGDVCLARAASRVTAETVRLVFVETDPSVFQERRVRIESIDPGVDAGAAIAQRRPDLLLVAAEAFAAADRHLLLESLRNHDRQLPLIVSVADDQGGELVIDAIRAGATDVVSDATPADRLRDKILVATERRRLQKRPTIRVDPMPNRNGTHARLERAVIGTSDGMLNVLCHVARFAEDQVPVLVHGEPGTGKSLLALLLHRRISRDDQRPFIIDCGQLAHDMLDRLLFDDAEGSVQLRAELAGRALILENVDHACVRVQRRLLSAIRRRSSLGEHPGSLHSQVDHPRLVMTNSTTVDPSRCRGRAADPGRDGVGLIDELLFELAGYAIELPPLRERGNDITKLIDHFVRTLTGTAPVDESGEHRITHEAKALLERYDWPGNVTQLRSVMASELQLGGGTIVLSERLLRLTGSRVSEQTALPAVQDSTVRTSAPARPNHSVAEMNLAQTWAMTVERFVANAAASDEPASLYGETIQEVEAGLITAVLEKTQGNLAQSARLLGITRVSLRRKIHSLGLQIPGRTAVP